MQSIKLKVAYTLSGVIAVLAAFASGTGLFLGGLYRDNDLVRSAWYGNDLVTLAVAVPLLCGSLLLAGRGSMRAHLVWLGSLSYMLYNYLFYLYGAAFNLLFLVYVALVALAVYALIMGLSSTPVIDISRTFRPATPVRWVSALMLLVPLIIGGLVELPRILNFMFTGRVPQDIIQTGLATGVVYATDLAFLMPAMVLGAVWLWQRRPWGYVLAAMLLVKGFAYPLALIAMALTGTIGDPLVPVYTFFCLACLLALVLLLWNLQPGGMPTRAASTGSLKEPGTTIKPISP